MAPSCFHHPAVYQISLLLGCFQLLQDPVLRAASQYLTWLFLLWRQHLAPGEQPVGVLRGFLSALLAAFSHVNPDSHCLAWLHLPSLSRYFSTPASALSRISHFWLFHFRFLAADQLKLSSYNLHEKRVLRDTRYL